LLLPVDRDGSDVSLQAVATAYESPHSHMARRRARPFGGKPLLAMLLVSAGILSACGGGSSPATPDTSVGQNGDGSGSGDGGTNPSDGGSDGGTTPGGGGGGDDTPAGGGNDGGTSTGGGSDSGGTSGTDGGVVSTTACASVTLSATDAQTLTGVSTTPLQTAAYGIRNYSAPVLVNGLHDPANYQKAPKLPTWQFATQDPTNGELTALECDTAPDDGWHSYVRSSGVATTVTHQKVIVTGGRNATADHIYTVFNGQQLVAAIKAAGLAPKIIRVVGHIDLRMSDKNQTFTEYTSYSDQKFGGSVSLPSNTTLVGINDAQGNPARITGTTLLIGGELGLTTAQLASANGDPEHDFKAWIAAGKDGDLYPTWTRNVIVRNLKIDTPWDVNPEDAANAYADGMTISRAQNVWIDHVTVTDGDTPGGLSTDTRHDANLDIVRGSDYVTVSNSFFGDHAKNTLVGNGDSGREWSDAGRLHVTLSRLWWSGIGSRMPLVRFAQLHTFNNLMQGWTTGSSGYGEALGTGLDVRYQASVFSENNFHQVTGLKPGQVCNKLVAGKDGVGYRIVGAQFISDKDDNGKAWSGGPVDVTSALSAVGCTKATLPTADIAWAPPYSYVALDAAAARTQVQVNTGAGRIGKFAVLGTASTDGSGDTGTGGNTGTAGPVVATWASDFSAATTANLFTAAAYPLPTDPTLPLYVNLGTKMTAVAGTVTMAKSTYFVIGASSSAATTATSAPAGAFDIVGKTCTLKLNAAAAVSPSDTGKFTVSVDNNTSSSANSPHGKTSVVVTVLGNSIVAGDNSWTWSLTDATWPAGTGSSITLRTDTGVSALQINSLALNCN
jgi:pectate lyase